MSTPMMDQEPIEHTWYECPNCGNELIAHPGGDYGPTTVYRCGDCSYRWAD